MFLFVLTPSMIFLYADSQRTAPVLDIYGYFTTLAPRDLSELTFNNTKSVPRASRSGLKTMPCITAALPHHRN